MLFTHHTHTGRYPTQSNSTVSAFTALHVPGCQRKIPCVQSEGSVHSNKLGRQAGPGARVYRK